MFDIVGFLKTIVTTYLSAFTWVQNSQWLANIEVDEGLTKLIYLERPIVSNHTIESTEISTGKYTIYLYFFVLTKEYNEGNATLNNYQETIDTSTGTCRTGVQTFLANLIHNSNVKKVSGFKLTDITDWPIFDANVSGYQLVFDVEIIKSGNLCQ